MVADLLKLSETDRATRLPSGRELLHNRCHWARYYLLRAGALEQTSRGSARITARGRELLAGNSPITAETLRAYPEFVEWLLASRRMGPGVGTDPSAAAAAVEPQSETAEERMQSAHLDLREDIESALLDQIREMTPAFFEDLVVRLLLRLGYGSDVEAGERIGRSGDGGVDGVIYEDKLSLDLVYIQAKRWQANVGRPDIQGFVGSLEGKRVQKGVFITTSDFTADAKNYAETIQKRVALINGRTLARLMFDSGLGVTTVATYEVKKIDTDYFTLSD